MPKTNHEPVTDAEIAELLTLSEWCDRHGYTASEFEAEFSDDESAYIAFAANLAPRLVADLRAAQTRVQELESRLEIYETALRSIRNPVLEPIAREALKR